jgi:septal ring-binding cell division protein DamX
VAGDRVAAQQILNGLKPHGGSAHFYITEFPQNDVTYYRVRMGFFSSREAAAAAGKDVSDKVSNYADFRQSQPTEAEFLNNGGKVVN